MGVVRQRGCGEDEGEYEWRRRVGGWGRGWGGCGKKEEKKERDTEEVVGSERWGDEEGEEEED